MVIRIDRLVSGNRGALAGDHWREYDAGPLQAAYSWPKQSDLIPGRRQFR